MDAIATYGLCKRYGSRDVLHDLTLRVRAGAMFGLLGPNGAGKTTTLRILMGLLRASAGRAEVFQHDVWREGPAVRADVGYLPGDIRFYDGMTGRATLAFLNAARGNRDLGEVRRLADVLDLDLDKRIRNYSRGMKQKLGLIAAMGHRPRLLILDEPTTALDPLVRQALFRELRQVAADGRTVLFSSHTLSEVESLCDEVAILRDGKLVEHDAIEALRRRAVRHVELLLAREDACDGWPAGLMVKQRSGVRVAAVWTGPVEPLLAWLVQVGVRDVSIGQPDLEDLFLAYYGHSAAEVAK